MLTSGPVAASGPRSAVLPGSAPRYLAHARVVGDVDADKQLDVVVTLQPRNPDLLASLAAQSSARAPLRPDQVEALFMPTRADESAVRSYLASHGFRFRGAHGLSLSFEGRAGAVEDAFGADLALYRDARGRSFRAADGPLKLPAALIEKVAAVDGLDTLARYRPAAQLAPSAALSPCGSAASYKNLNGGYLPADFASASGYNYQPLLDAGHDGDGEVIAFVEFSDYLPSNVNTFKSCFGLTTPVTDVAVSGGTTNRFAAGEVTLDVEIALAAAPGLDATYVYKAPATTSMAAMINRIVADQPVTGVHIISISWGLCERFLPSSELSALNSALQLAAVSGMSVFAASGDNGSSDCAPDFNGLAVDDPASQPYATAVGGTNLDLSAGRAESTWNSEWGSGGGGLSARWPLPSWQAGIVGPDSAADPCSASPDYCRHVPDVSLNADPENGYIIYCSTEDCGYSGWVKVGGTSASAPLLAAITADANEYSLANGGQRLGFASPFLYERFAAGATFFLDVTDGSNDVFTLGKYSAATGYDLATGLGSLDGAAFAQDLAAYTASALDVHDTAVSASPTANKTVTYGKTVTFSGVLTDRTAGTPIAGRTVWLELRDALGTRSWRAVTNASGQWSVSLSSPLRRKETWQALYLGAEGMAAAQSPSRIVYVVPKLALTSTAKRVSGHYVIRHGTTFTVKGTTRPNMAGTIVALQWRPASSSRWRTAGSARVGARGGLSARGSWTLAGRYYMRWRYSGGTGKPWMTANSPAKLFVVS
jgi:subtilase family serine protease